MKESIEINGKRYVDYNESDLRFTGWESECIIIDRCENHYLIPIDRYIELKTPKIKQDIIVESKGVSEGVSGCCGITGTVGTKNVL